MTANSLQNPDPAVCTATTQFAGILPDSATLPSVNEAAAGALGDVVVVLPAYNEAQSLRPLLEAVRSTMHRAEWPYSVIVVDDGSLDETADVVSQAALEMPIDLVRHPTNQGLAAALRTGLRTAVQRSSAEDVVVTMDADNTHPPKLIPGMLQLLAGDLDVVIASRYRPGAQISGVPANRNVLSMGARYLFQAAFPTAGVRDYTCGYRAYRVGPLAAAMRHFGDRFITEEGFSCMAEVLLNLRAYGLRMGEIPLELNYERRGNASKMKVARTVGQTLSLIVRQRLPRTR